LLELFDSFDQLVYQQEPVVRGIDEKVKEVHENTVKASIECGKAVESSRSRNRKKWWILLVVVLVIMIVVIVAVVATIITQKAKPA
jgi:syntaxin 1B/2/3